MKRFVIVVCVAALLHFAALFTLGKFNRVDVEPVSGRQIPANAFVTCTCRALQYPLISTDVVLSGSTTRIVATITANSLLWGLAVSLASLGVMSVMKKERKQNNQIQDICA